MRSLLPVQQVAYSGSSLITGRNDISNCRVNNMGGEIMKKGEKLIVIGCGGVGGPAAMMAKKLMPDVDVTIIRKEDRFIVR
jgi:Zn-dependent alcohol dehydrogenase